MRTFQLIFIVVFILLYSLISYGAIKALLGIARNQLKRKLLWILSIISGLVLLLFFFLYVWPLTTRNLKDYTIHLIFNAILSIDFVFKIPLLFSFLAGQFFRIDRKKVVYIMGIVLSVAMSCSMIYGSLFGTKDLVVNNVKLNFSNLPENFDGVRIAQISDIHLGNFLKSATLMTEVQEEIKNINPDLIFFTGDLVNNFSNECYGWDKVFNKITDNKKSYSILGNHDYGNYTNWDSEDSKKKNFDEIVEAQKRFGFEMLDNSNVKLKIKNDSIYLIGVENWGHPPFPQYANLDQAMKGIPENTFKILLSHDPAHWDEIVKYRNDIDLTLSGHTHGFQWGIMKAGITFSLAYLARKNWGGSYKFRNSQLYVNAGLGTVGIPWRINMPAELTVFTLKRVKID